MQNPLEISFRDLRNNEKIEKLIQEKFDKLEGISPDITKCHVILEKLSKHHQTANAACVRLDLKVANFDDIVISEKCSEEEGPLMSAVNKIFKRSQELVRKEKKRRQDRHRIPRPDKKADITAEVDEDLEAEVE